ncbi:MAG: helix-turn-helix domain-containing protein [Clostridium sp.]|nr:helix-turn-helix domain-containing protein [Clostridium sp.]
MNFCEQLNKYIEQLECSSKELVIASGLSSTVISRYRNGERTPNIRSKQLEQLADGLYKISQNKNINLTRNEIYNVLSSTLKDIAIDFEQLSKNFSAILLNLNISIADLSRAIGYDASLLSKIRSGNKNPSRPQEFVESVCNFIVTKYRSENDKKSISLLIGCSLKDLNNISNYFNKLSNWLSSNSVPSNNKIDTFLNNLDNFDLDKYIKSIHFDEMKVPFVPFYKFGSKTYYGIEEMKQGELDFFKATVLSKSNEPIFMCSDMPMNDMAEDVDFGKRWMFAIAMTLKKGLHLNIIHNLNRPFNEMMLGLESWIPIYMTGQVSPYYLTGLQNSIYCHLNYVSGTVALTGECIKGYHNKGKYHLTSNKTDIAYNRTKSECLLNKAKSLMDIYRIENKNAFDAFISSDANIEGHRRRILSSLPIHTISDKLLLKILKRNKVNDENIKAIQDSVEKQRDMIQKILKNNILEDEIVQLSEDEFVNYPPFLSLSDSFYVNDICYNYEEYLEHLNDTKKYMSSHDNYKILKNKTNTFRNINITIHSGKWVMISKNTHPAIHFVIHHPKLRDAIENFIAPVVE